MKSTILTRITATTLFAGLALPAQIIAQTGPQHQRDPLAHYRVTDLGPLKGGTSSYATGITDKGLIGGHAGLPGGTWHAVLWHKQQIKDLGTLGGQDSIAFGVNEWGRAAGESETSEPDPNSEDFCGFKALGLPSFGNTCLAFVWQHGMMTPLPTLGGPNAAGNQINNRGEVAGIAETMTRDTNCPSSGPQKLEFKPVVWRNGQVEELPTASGDRDGVALGINEHAQVVGGSGSCTVFNQNFQIYLQPSHALLWENGRVIDLKNLGGKFGNLAFGINNQGQVVGNSDLPGDTISHAFLWSKETGMQDLRPFHHDINSGALGLNDRGEVVGTSLDANFNLRATLWQNRVPVDLNALVIDNDSGLYLQLAESINSRGEIVGFALQRTTGDTHAYLATPCHRHDDGRECCEDHDR